MLFLIRGDSVFLYVTIKIVCIWAWYLTGVLGFWWVVFVQCCHECCKLLIATLLNLCPLFVSACYLLENIQQILRRTCFFKLNRATLTCIQTCCVLAKRGTQCKRQKLNSFMAHLVRQIKYNRVTVNIIMRYVFEWHKLLIYEAKNGNEASFHMYRFTVIHPRTE